MSHRVLLIEDEKPIQQIVRDTLEMAGHELITCDTGEEALEQFHQVKPDVVVLDWMLPGKDGLEVLKELVSISQTPVIMASAKTDDDDIDLVFKAGAADYVKKPYGGKELLNKIQYLAAKPVREDSSMVKIGPIDIDVSAYEVRRNGVKILLTPLEFNLLLTIAEDPKHTFTREELLKKVWLHKNLNEQSDFKGKIDTRLVNVHIQRLRSKIEENPDDPKIVATVRGRGYKAGQE